MASLTRLAGWQNSPKQMPRPLLQQPDFAAAGGKRYRRTLRQRRLCPDKARSYVPVVRVSPLPLTHTSPAPSESSLDCPLLAPPFSHPSQLLRAVTQSGGATLASYLARDAPVWSTPHQPLGVGRAAVGALICPRLKEFPPSVSSCLWRISVRLFWRQ